MKLQDYLHYYLGCKMIRSSHWEPQNEPYILHFEVIWEAVEFGDRPLLRRLEDLTRDDMKPIYQLVFGKPFPDSGRIAWFDKEERTAAKRFVMMSGVDRVGIEMNGYVWADCDLSHVKFNPHFISHYLLSKGFDLFGLIPAGLAIDIKTIDKCPSPSPTSPQ